MPDFKLAFIYRPSNPYLCGLRYNNNYSKFYFGALPRCEGVRVDYFGAEDVFDCRTIAGRYDAYLFYEAIEWGIPPS